MSLFPRFEPLPNLPTLLIIPSGIGCSIGGYAGDAIPVARLLAAASGLLITHPNVLNGASLYWPDSRFQYVEGFGNYQGTTTRTYYEWILITPSDYGVDYTFSNYRFL